MANALYPKWKENLLQFTTNNNPSSGTVKAALVTSSYAYNSSHQFWSSASANVVGTPQTLGSKTYTNGVLDAADVTYTAVAAGTAASAIIIYIDTGTTTTSPLMAYIDTSVTGLPVTPNGGDINITWNASGIFGL